MRVFVDSSAIFAFLDEADVNHRRAVTWLGRARKTDTQLFTHNYVVVEATALSRRRLGTEGTRRLLDDLAPAFEVMFIDRELHRISAAAYKASGLGPASFVDRASFELMREEGVSEAFAFDRHFEAEGFTLVA
ncbi:MAG: PIN domain-containing protein [Actinobacteria bacterium]|nr:PIN domain-containing protein [Actinomycetota bacterium]